MSIRNLEGLAFDAVISIDRIDISNRKRKKFDDDMVAQIAASIAQTGLTNPITVKLAPDSKEGDRKYILIAGETRIRCHNILNKESIRARVYPEDTSRVEALTIEIDENVKRSNFTWQEEVEAISQLQQLMRSEGEDCSGQTIARRLNVSDAKISNDLTLANAISNNAEIASAATKQEAMKLVKRQREEAIKRTISSRSQAREIVKTRDMIVAETARRYIIGDCIAGMKKLQSSTVNMVELDPPYGIDYDKTVKKLQTNVTHYEDTKDYAKLMTGTLAEAYRLLKEDSWITCWCSVKRLDETFKLLEAAKFKVRPAPMIWAKRNIGRCMFPEANLTTDYEVCLYASKGDAKLNKQGASSIIEGKSAKRTSHPNEKPMAVIQHILDIFCIPNDIVVSPFLGSGNTIIAGRRLDLEVFGFDLEERYKDDFITGLAVDERAVDDVVSTVI